MSSAAPRLVVSCEHGGNRVPRRYASLFDSPGGRAALKSHRGYDPGALDAAKQMASAMGVELISAETTRLLVDLNRSLDNPSLFSKYSNRLTEAERNEMLRSYYHPYRERVESVVGGGTQIQARKITRVVHLSVHTFTPRMAGIWRPIDIGLLFDPASPTETDICTRWQQGMLLTHRRLRVVANLPYAGTDDGLTTHLRTRWPASEYAGIEIEINHRFFKRSRETQRKIVQALLETFPHLET